jgi:hypothetical protein
MAPLQLAGARMPLVLRETMDDLEYASLPETLGEAQPANDQAQFDAMGNSLDRIRQTVASLRASDKRVRDMVEGLELANRRAEVDLETVTARLEAAEMRIALEAARADAAEQRCRETEARFSQILNGLADELEASA